MSLENKVPNSHYLGFQLLQYLREVKNSNNNFYTRIDPEEDFPDIYSSTLKNIKDRIENDFILKEDQNKVKRYSGKYKSKLELSIEESEEELIKRHKISSNDDNTMYQIEQDIRFSVWSYAEDLNKRVA